MSSSAAVVVGSVLALLSISLIKLEFVIRRQRDKSRVLLAQRVFIMEKKEEGRHSVSRKK